MSEERTEKPTPKKLKESRKEGQIPRTQEFGGWGALLLIAVILNWLVAHAVGSIQELLVRVMAVAGHATEADALELLGEGGRMMLVMAATFGSIIMAVGVLAGGSQGGIHVASKMLKPKFSRLDPIKGAKRIFGLQALWEGGKTLLKSAVVAFFVWRAVQGLLPLLGGLVPLDAARDLITDQVLALMREVALAGLVAAAADYAFQRRKVGKQIRMTKKEIRDEHKQAEGDPLIRQALRSRQLAAARNRMMSDIPTADVVLVNPVHVAVALRYDTDKGAPRVVAKGAGAVAARIREAAEGHQVPLVEDIALARALHASCEIGQEIPIQLYEAVAQVLAYVLSRRGRGTTATRYRTPRVDPLPEVPNRRRRALPATSSVTPSSPGSEDR